jgi:hypothetical protein
MNNKAQLHTLEGLGAAVLMTLTILTIAQSTMIVTPQNELVMTVQLEQMTSDALAVIDIAPHTAIQNNLTECVAQWNLNESEVTSNNLDTLNEELAILLPGIQYNVDLTYSQNGNINTKNAIINGAPTEDAVVVRRLVTLSKASVDSAGGSWNIADDELLVVEVKLTAWII